ncbi:MAG: homocysteine S-methyltransferase family protein, partial [Clostridia bacterium]|nr:homocysteine S-methyltransferase family protein [Clostridia bacterium]
EKFVALDIGPTGKLLKPLGDLCFEAAVEVFAATVRIGAKYGADLILIETMNDSFETKAALLAAKENCDLPVIVSNAYGEDGKLMTGATPAAMAALIEGMGADALGANCSLGPKQLAPVIKELLKNSSIPVMFKPNAGLPKAEGGKTVFDVGAEEFAAEVAALADGGVRIVGGCCGTTPDYIRALKRAVAGIKPEKILPKNLTVVSSYAKAVTFGDRPILIGERINPTGKPLLKEAITKGDTGYILSEGIGEQEKGVHILDVNVGMPGIDEAAVLKGAVCGLQAVVDLPLQIDTSSIPAMEAAMRVYNGKPMINSVNGKEESMRAVFPLVKKYGGVCVALTLDENGIPDTAQGRVDIAKKIIAEAEKYGICRNNLVFDTLCMAVSAVPDSAKVTLGALKQIREELGCHTVLGVSNVSFGLPGREGLNSTFFAMALENGLSAAIMNPYSADMMKTHYAFCALSGRDENFAEYIAFAESAAPPPQVAEAGGNAEEELKTAIRNGLNDKAGEITARLIKTESPLRIVNDTVIPALNFVGTGFENKTVYLPGLLMSAEAAKAAFEVIKRAVPAGKKRKNGGVFVIATVKGDIHDIGKNIVKLLLQNYGFEVYDLGKDVAPEVIADKAVELGAPLVGLSALMTTTVPAMEETIKLLRVRAPGCKIIVGGAVLTEEYAAKIGADKYAKDAMEAVRYAQETVARL